MFHKFKNLIFFCAILAVACGKSPTVETVKVLQGSVESTIVGVSSGTVQAERTADLAFGAVGRVKALNVDVGSVVKNGDILAELENEDLKSNVSAAEAEFKRAATLSNKNAVSDSQQNEALRVFEVAKGAYEKSFIRAPFDGLITAMNLEVGQLSQITAVVPKPLMTIVDNLPRYVELELDELDLSKVTSGLPARIKIPAVRKEPFLGSVRKVVPYISTLKEQDRTADVEISINPENLILPVGASADVEIITERKDKILYLPSKAVLGRSGNRFVYLLEGSRIRKVQVEAGLQNFDRVEIKKGLSENHLVVMPSDKLELADGIKVKVQEK
jgi:HlyD family secretion protein